MTRLKADVPRDNAAGLIPDVLVLDGRSTPNHYIVRSKSVGVNADCDPVVSPEVEIFYPVLDGYKGKLPAVIVVPIGS